MARLALVRRTSSQPGIFLHRIQTDVDRRGSCIGQGSGAGFNWWASQALDRIGLARTSFTRRTFSGTNSRLMLFGSYNRALNLVGRV